MSRSGTGAPPVMMKRTLERSALVQCVLRVSASSRSGLPNPTVTRSRSIASSTSSGVVATGTTTVPPLNSNGRTFTPMPPVRKSGASASVTSSLRKSATESMLITFHVTLACVSMTPFGEPVVPDVCGMMHTSSGSTRASARVARALAIEILVAPCRCRATNVDDVHARRKLDRRRGILDDHHLHRVVVEDAGNGGGRQPVVHRREDRTELRHREERLEEGRVVLAEPSHAVAVRDSELAQARREPADALGQFGIAPPCRTVHQRNVVGCSARSPFDPGADAGERGHRRTIPRRAADEHSPYADDKGNFERGEQGQMSLRA